MAKKVMVVDGDKQLIPILKDAFHKIGFEVFVESARDQAIQLARDKVPDLIIVSVELPAGPAEGYLACKDFKTDEKLKSVPLLLTSRKAKEEDFAKHRKLKTRADDYLKKPFTDEDLFQRIENLLGFEISKQDYGALEQKMHTYLEQQTRLEDELNERNLEISKLQAQVADLETALAAAQAEKGKPDAKYKEKLADAEALLDGYKSKNRELTAEVEKLNEDASAIDQELQELRQREDELNSEVQRLQNQLDAAMAEIKALENDVEQHNELSGKIRETAENLISLLPKK